MRNAELQKFRERARDEILAWMDSKSPRVTRTALAKLLGYANSAETSRSLGAGGGLPGEAFLLRIADRIPELAGLKHAYYEVLAGGATITKSATNARRRAEILRDLGELEAEAIATVRRLCDTARRAAK